MTTDTIARGLAVGAKARAWAAGRSGWDNRPAHVDAVMATPPTIGSTAASSAIASGITWPAITVQKINRDRFTYIGGNIQTVGTGFPDYGFVKANAVTSTGGVQSSSGTLDIEFLFDGTTLEAIFKGNSSLLRLRVDGELVTAGATSMGSAGSATYLPITFATRAIRRITIEGASNPFFAGVVTGPNDTIIATQVQKPRVIVIGDSFTEGTGATVSVASNWVRRFASEMGWQDVWASGVGATGILNPSTGGKVKFRDRVAADVIAFAPDIWIVAGGINDWSTYTAAAIGTEAAALFATLKAALPNSLGVVVAPFWRNGVETITYNFYDAKDAIKAAAVAAGLIHIDLIELPMSEAGISTTLTLAATANVTSLTMAALVPVRSTIEIGTGATRERRVVTAIAGGGPYIATVAQTTYAHSSGDPVQTVGGALWTGTGRVGATTGSGNSDLLVSSDQTHPSQAGHDAIGAAVAAQFRAALLSAIA